MRRLAGTAVAAMVLAASLAAMAAEPWRVPGPPDAPPGNPTTAAKVELGRQLFYDADLSVNGTIACATCHEQHHAFADGQRTRQGVHGEPGRRNVMALGNVAYFRSLTWTDFAQDTLERQVFIPLVGETPVEMGMKDQDAALKTRLGSDACYPRQFAAAFPETKGAIETYSVAQALAAFERTLISVDAPYDRYRAGQTDAIPESAKRGEALFFGRRLNCAGCHAGPLFTDAATVRAKTPDSFHDIGRPRSVLDRGLAEVTEDRHDEGRYRTPSLRNAALTAPYMHDGSVATLTEAIRAHRTAARIKDAEAADLTVFIETLTDQGFVTDPRFSLPKPCA